MQGNKYIWGLDRYRVTYEFWYKNAILIIHFIFQSLFIVGK